MSDFLHRPYSVLHNNKRRRRGEMIVGVQPPGCSSLSPPPASPLARRSDALLLRRALTSLAQSKFLRSHPIICPKGHLPLAQSASYTRSFVTRARAPALSVSVIREAIRAQIRRRTGNAVEIVVACEKSRVGMRISLRFTATRARARGISLVEILIRTYLSFSIRFYVARYFFSRQNFTCDTRVPFIVVRMHERLIILETSNLKYLK